MEQQEPIRDARKLGIPKMLILGLQHMFAMFGATILVPILVNGYFNGEGLSIQVTLICAGLGTLFFHLCAKLKVPAFLGSSFTFLGGFSAVAHLNTGKFATMTMAASYITYHLNALFSSIFSLCGKIPQFCKSVKITVWQKVSP